MTERFDTGWVNRSTNLGVLGKDKNRSSSVEHEPLREMEAEDLFAADDIAAKMVSKIPEDMVRAGFRVVVPDWSEETTSDFMRYLEATFDWKTAFFEALFWGRLYGGSGMLCAVDDGAKNLAEPLNEKNIRSFKWVCNFSRWELTYNSLQDDPTKPDYGLPLTYMLTPMGGAKSQDGKLIGSVVHASRIIRFDGEYLPRRAFQANSYWHDSILTKRFNAIRNYSTGHDSAATLVSDFAQAIFKIKDLHEILGTEDGKKLLNKRLDIIENFRSVINCVAIDMDEEFERKSTSVTGLPDLLDRQANRLVASSEYPHTVLLGESPGASLGEAGQAQERAYFGTVENYQHSRMKKQLMRFLRLVFLDKSGPTKGKEPAEWSIEFEPLYQEPMSVTLDNQKKQAEIDKLYVDAQVLAAEEIAKSRYGSGQFSFETKLEYERDFSVSPQEQAEEAAEVEAEAEGEEVKEET